MPVPKDVIGIKGDECQCGRRASRLHCIYCGSTRIHTRRNKPHTHMDGHEALVPKQHVCDTCGEFFIPEEREWCKAVPVGAAAATRKLQVLAEAEGNPSVSPEQNAEAKRILLEHLRKRASPAEARAIETLEEQLSPTAEQAYQKDQIFITQIRGAYNEEILAAKTKGVEFNDTFEEFLIKCRGIYEHPEVPKP